MIQLKTDKIGHVYLAYYLYIPDAQPVYRREHRLRLVLSDLQ